MSSTDLVRRLVTGMDSGSTRRQCSSTTYMPEAGFNIFPTIVRPTDPRRDHRAGVFASSTPFSLIVNDENQEGVNLLAEALVDKVWPLAITLLLIMICREELVERGGKVS